MKRRLAVAIGEQRHGSRKGTQPDVCKWHRVTGETTHLGRYCAHVTPLLTRPPIAAGIERLSIPEIPSIKYAHREKGNVSWGVIVFFAQHRPLDQEEVEKFLTAGGGGWSGWGLGLLVQAPEQAELQAPKGAPFAPW